MLKLPKIKQLVIGAAKAQPPPPPPQHTPRSEKLVFSGAVEVTESSKH